jgi:hypothetical protein
MKIRYILRFLTHLDECNVRGPGGREDFLQMRDCSDDIGTPWLACTWVDGGVEGEEERGGVF